MSLFLLCCILMLQAHAQQLPYWSAPYPNATAPLGGYKLLPNRSNYLIFLGTVINGTNNISGDYNHAAMIGYHNGLFTVLWKNGQGGEDKNGQRILYSQSQDGKHWTAADVFFPNISTPSIQAAMFVGPPIIINNRMYVGASPGNVNHKAAQGAQFCVYPQPIDPRNCGPAGPDGVQGQENHTLLMREVLSGIGNLGEIFWESSIPPSEFASATKMFNIPTVTQMDTQTQNDMALLTKDMEGFCDGDNQENATLKCEVAQHGVRNYHDIVTNESIANELCHYILPSNDGDVVLYRSGNSERRFYVSMRNITNDNNGKVFGNWSNVQITNIPDVDSNLNCGPLPDGRIYLLSNPVYNEPGRNPVTIATSKDGLNFDKVGVIMSCTDFNATSTCKARNTGNKDGPAYPQGITIMDPAPADIQGFWVVASNNKEDIWITHVPFSVIP